VHVSDSAKKAAARREGPMLHVLDEDGRLTETGGENLKILVIIGPKWRFRKTEQKIKRPFRLARILTRDQKKPLPANEKEWHAPRSKPS